MSKQDLYVCFIHVYCFSFRLSFAFHEQQVSSSITLIVTLQVSHESSHFKFHTNRHTSSKAKLIHQYYIHYTLAYTHLNWNRIHTFLLGHGDLSEEVSDNLVHLLSPLTRSTQVVVRILFVSFDEIMQLGKGHWFFKNTSK